MLARDGFLASAAESLAVKHAGLEIFFFVKAFAQALSAGAIATMLSEGGAVVGEVDVVGNKNFPAFVAFLLAGHLVKTRSRDLREEVARDGAISGRGSGRGSGGVVSGTGHCEECKR